MTLPHYVRTIEWQRRRERIFAVIGLALGAAMGVAAALALSGCMALSVPPATVNVVHAGQRQLMFENFQASALHWTW